MKIPFGLALAIAASPLPLSFDSSSTARAQDHGSEGGGREVRSTSRGSINGGDHDRSNDRYRINIDRADDRRDDNRNYYASRDYNVNSNNYGGGSYHGRGCYRCDWDDDDGNVGAVALAAVAGAVVGPAVSDQRQDTATLVYSPATTTTVAYAPGIVVTALPAGCSAATINGYAYQKCGEVWFQLQFVGTTLQYIVVNAPM